jgi:hypothetical protein
MPSESPWNMGQRACVPRVDCRAGPASGRRERGDKLTAESAMAEVTTDHKTIQKWAETHGGKPAAVDRTHVKDDVGIIRVMFPQAPQSEHQHLLPISWDEFFKEFDKRKLALVYDPESMFSKIVGRDAVGSADSRRKH